MQLKSFILSILLCTATASFAQMGTDSLVFHGRVVNDKGIPINKAIVQGYHTGIAFETGFDGLFRIKLPAQGDSVIISKEGLASFTQMLEFSASGVFILNESEASWMSQSEYVKKMEATAKVYYDAGIKYLEGEADNGPDTKKAFACFWRAANMEHAQAAYQVGKMYDEGIGMTQNYANAVDWYKKAGRVLEAQTRLGVMYAEGIGVKQNYLTAAHHFRSAIILGDTIAARHIREMKEKGLIKEETFPDDFIFEIAEHTAQFSGGDDACYAWLANHIRYPAIAQQQGIQGRVFVRFVVNKDGSITDVEIMRSPDPSLSKEAVRVIRSMPPWKPAMQGGKPVRCRFSLPLMFRLS